MLAILLASAAAGVCCGSVGLNIFALVSVTAVFWMTTAVGGSAAGLGLGTSVLAIAIGTALLQLFYLIGALLSRERTAPAFAPMSASDFVGSVQSAIGQEMRMSLALPVDLPPELDRRLAQVKLRYG